MITIEIKEEIKPYVRMTQRGKYVNKYALLYMANHALIQTLIREQLYQNPNPHERFEWYNETPIKVTMVFETPTPHKCDLDNLVKSVLDASQIILFRNDSWIDCIQATRIKAKEFRLIYTLEAYKPNEQQNKKGHL